MSCCIVCGDEMVQVSPGISTCDCPMRGYRPRTTIHQNRPIDRPIDGWMCVGIGALGFLAGLLLGFGICGGP